MPRGAAGPVRDLALLRFRSRDLAAVRRTVARVSAVRIPRHRVDDVVLAVHELAANSIIHGGGSGRLRAWETPAELVFEVSDDGPGAPGPVLSPPPVDAGSGRGLWLAHELCDDLRICRAADHTVVQVHIGRQQPGGATTD